LKHLNSSSIGHNYSDGIDSDSKRAGGTSKSEINQDNRRKKKSSVELFISSPNRLRALTAPIPASNISGQRDLPKCTLSKPIESLYYSGDNNADITLDNNGKKSTHKASDHWLKGKVFSIYAYVFLSFLLICLSLIF
jgi:hypothetical protein